MAARVTLNRMRNSIRMAADRYHLPRTPRTLRELAQLLRAHPEISTTVDGRDNVFMALVGPEGHQSVVFFSRRLADYLNGVSTIFSDGTFDSRPSRPNTAEVFVISTDHNHHVSVSLWPALFCFFNE